MAVLCLNWGDGIWDPSSYCRWGDSAISTNGLGVVLDASFSTEAQITNVVILAFCNHWMIRQLVYLSSHDLTAVVYAMVTSTLDYCNLPYVELPLGLILILAGISCRGFQLSIESDSALRYAELLHTVLRPYAVRDMSTRKLYAHWKKI